MSKKQQLIHLIDDVVAANPQNVDEVIDAINQHFSTITWSLLKDEWVNHMSKQDRVRFAKTIYDKHVKKKDR